MKICYHLTFYYDETRLKYINLILNEINNYQYVTDVFIHCNTNFQLDKIIKYSNGKIYIVTHNLNQENPFFLTWKHRDLMKKQLNFYDVFIYTEDDILIPKSALNYWQKYNEILNDNNYNLGFLRIEKVNSIEYTTDIYYKYFFKKKEQINNQLYLINDINPYCAMWIYNKKTFSEFVNSKYWNISNTPNIKKIYGIRESAAIGLHGKGNNWFKNTVIPFKNYELDEDCKIFHLPCNYYNKIILNKFNQLYKKQILFIHQNFPSQFVHLSKYLNNKSEYDIQSMSFHDSPITEIKHHKCILGKNKCTTKNSLCIEFESKVVRATITVNKCNQLYLNYKYYPDLVIAHSGWGESLLLKNLWSNVKILDYMEIYYENINPKLVLRNAPYLISLTNSDAYVSPTNYQKSTFPPVFHEKINVIFEGIDTDFFKKKEIDNFKIGILRNKTKWKHKIVKNDNLHLFNKIYSMNTKKDKIITFISRDLTSIRGYDTFVESLPYVLNEYPDAYIIIVGNDGYSYVAPPPVNQTYKDIFFNKVKDKINTDHIFFLGKVEKNEIIDILSISTLHIYLTEPFCLSWSFFEALSMETLMISSDNQPTNEVIVDNHNGILIKNLKDPKELGLKICEVLKNPNQYNLLRKNARDTIVNNYDLNKICIPKYEKLIKSLIN